VWLDRENLMLRVAMALSCGSRLRDGGPHLRGGAPRQRRGCVFGRVSCVALLSALASCSSTDPNFSFSNLIPKTGAGAVARLSPRNGSTVTGTVTFVQRGDKVGVAAIVQNLDSGPHSMYIHEVGNCKSPNAASAGRVWSLLGAAPGRPRIGNMPEITANSEGTANLSTQLRGVTVGDGSPLDIIGHSAVVHSGLDPDPRPEFGVRNGWLACGVIERQE
jgi:superoxide dismutase, Cu-Zn family